ncbi:MAG TPA: hypothetical protein VMB77_15135 [Syntrophales bacterium]|nr:hypothetical protein [Syntrophales bacterium]
MYVEIEDFKTGWYGITVGLSKAEINKLIERLEFLRDNNDQHFHIRSNYEGIGGVGDIEIYFQKNAIDNMILE